MGAMGAPETLDRLIGAPTRLQQVMHPPGGIGAAEIGVIAAARTAGHGEHQNMRFSPAMKAAVSARLAEAGRLRSARRSDRAFPGGDPGASVSFSTRRARPGDLGDGLMAEAVQDLIEGGLHRRQRGELLDQRIAGGDGLPAQDRVAIGTGHGSAHQVAVVISERLLQLHRKGVGEVVEYGLARGQINTEIVPFGRRDLGDAPFHQCLPGGDQLDDGGAPGGEIGLDGADQRRAFHRR